MTTPTSPSRADSMQSAAVWFAGLTIGEAGSATRGERLSLAAGRFKVPDTTADGVSLPGLEIRAAAVRGLSHRHWSSPRQDAYAFDAGPGWWVAAVADGVGSLTHSHIASHVAAGHAVATLGDLLRTGRPVELQQVFGTASVMVEPALREITGDLESPVEWLGATTLTVAYGVRQSPDRWLLQVGSVGDCRCATLAGQEWSCLADPAEPDPSSPVSTRTDALPLAPASALRTATALLRPGEGVAVFTDGIGAPFGSGQGQVGGQLAAWWAEPPHSIAFAGQVGFIRRGFHDDRACVAVWLTPTPGEQSGPPVDRQGSP